MYATISVCFSLGLEIPGLQAFGFSTPVTVTLLTTLFLRPLVDFSLLPHLEDMTLPW